MIRTLRFVNIVQKVIAKMAGRGLHVAKFHVNGRLQGVNLDNVSSID